MIESKFALGSAQFGMDYGISNNNGIVNPNEVKKIISYAQKKNINLIDTAINYGDSEISLGDAGIENFQIVTKLPKIPKSCKDISKFISDNIYNSIRRLKRKNLNTILLHNPMQLLDAKGHEIWNALIQNKNDGFVNKIGYSIYSPDELEDLYFNFKPDVVQFPFNVFDRRIQETGWLEKLSSDKTETHARSVFLQGLLLMNKEDRPKHFLRWKNLWNLWDELLNSHNISALEACIGFIMLNENLDKIIIGVNSEKQLREILNCDFNFVSLDDFLKLNANDLDLINPSRWA